MTTLSRCADLFTDQDNRNYRGFWLWAGAAIVAYLGFTILVKLRVLERGPLAWAAAALVSVFAVLALCAYVVFLRGADELLRRIQLEGLALGFGVGVVFMFGYRIFERLGAPQIDTSDPIVVMMVFWAIGQYIGMRRYLGEEVEA